MSSEKIQPLHRRMVAIYHNEFYSYALKHPGAYPSWTSIAMGRWKKLSGVDVVVTIDEEGPSEVQRILNLTEWAYDRTLESLNPIQKHCYDKALRQVEAYEDRAGNSGEFHAYPTAMVLTLASELVNAEKAYSKGVAEQKRKAVEQNLPYTPEERWRPEKAGNTAPPEGCESSLDDTSTQATPSRAASTKAAPMRATLRKATSLRGTSSKATPSRGASRKATSVRSASRKATISKGAGTKAKSLTQEASSSASSRQKSAPSKRPITAPWTTSTSSSETTIGNALVEFLEILQFVMLFALSVQDPVGCPDPSALQKPSQPRQGDSLPDLFYRGEWEDNDRYEVGGEVKVEEAEVTKALYLQQVHHHCIGRFTEKEQHNRLAKIMNDGTLNAGERKNRIQQLGAGNGMRSHCIGTQSIMYLLGSEQKTLFLTNGCWDVVLLRGELKGRELSIRSLLEQVERKRPYEPAKLVGVYTLLVAEYMLPNGRRLRAPKA
ncbi:hypothetical protein NMY22_g13774 [Coprinellus aureogranulatus]|nr:hypothetical protein NMY22_g13774 [Coprinellus aureogranulatus]